MSTSSRVRTRATIGWRDRARARRAQEGSETGSVLVEAAFVFPVFILLLFGMIEFGFVFNSSLTVSNMVEAGARVGAETGNDTAPSADYSILSAIQTASGSVKSTINYVVIFDADGSALSGGSPLSAPPADCVTAAAINNGGVANECNDYTGAYVTGLTTAAAANMGCNTSPGPDTGSGGCADSEWPPSERNVTEINGPDYLGVYVNTTHRTVTGFWKGVTLSDTVVMRLEPQAFGSS